MVEAALGALAGALAGGAVSLLVYRCIVLHQFRLNAWSEVIGSAKLLHIAYDRARKTITCFSPEAFNAARIGLQDNILAARSQMHCATARCEIIEKKTGLRDLLKDLKKSEPYFNQQAGLAWWERKGGSQESELDRFRDEIQCFEQVIEDLTARVRELHGSALRA